MTAPAPLPYGRAVLFMLAQGALVGARIADALTWALEEAEGSLTRCWSSAAAKPSRASPKARALTPSVAICGNHNTRLGVRGCSHQAT
jgi:hypothetical protein